MKYTQNTNPLFVLTLLSLFIIACSENSASQEQNSSAEAVITFEGTTYTLNVFQCLRDYPAPLEPDEIIAFALDAVHPDTPQELIEPISGVPDMERITQQTELLTPILQIGPVFSTGHYENGMDIMVFYPTSSIEGAVFAINEDGFIVFSGEKISGSVNVEDIEGNARDKLTFTAECPS